MSEGLVDLIFNSWECFIYSSGDTGLCCVFLMKLPSALNLQTLSLIKLSVAFMEPVPDCFVILNEFMVFVSLPSPRQYLFQDRDLWSVSPSGERLPRLGRVPGRSDGGGGAGGGGAAGTDVRTAGGIDGLPLQKNAARVAQERLAVS